MCYECLFAMKSYLESSWLEKLEMITRYLNCKKKYNSFLNICRVGNNVQCAISDSKLTH